MAGHTSRPGPRITAKAAVAAFVVADLLALVLVSVAVAWLVGRDATTNAIRGARDLTVAEGRAAVYPLLTVGVLDGNRAALAALDHTVRQRVLSDQIVRVKVWSSGGTILYSDEARLIGATFPLQPDERTALTSGQAHADLSVLTAPENIYERPFTKLLEVYDGLRVPGGPPVLFEAYIKFSSVSAESHRTVVLLLPVMLAALLLLFLAQIPLASIIVRRLERSQAEERRLLRQALIAADVERRHIAADLHDGSVQALAGTALSLTAAADEARKGGLQHVADQVAEAARDLRQGVRELRTLIVAVAPPRLHEEGLATALQDLVSPLTARGAETNLTVQPDLDLTPEVEALAYRSAQEAIRNIVRHAPDARRVSVVVSQVDGRLEVAISDDGAGFRPEDLEERRSSGHLGLQLLADLATEAGGCLEVSSAPGEGTLVRLEIPVR